MAATVRALVSQKKLRYQKDGFDLDLSYITPRIVAMGYPSSGREGMYRNPMPEVQRFFETYHKDHYKVYNLCSERVYKAESFSACARYPFDDHNPCPFPTLLAFCQDAAAWHAADPNNVIAIHCKAGKGRTGLIICAYLLYSGQSNTADLALKFFAVQRTSNSKGVAIPSQIRYVKYFATFLKKYHRIPKPMPLPEVKLVLTGFTMSPSANFDVGGGCDPYYKISRMDGTIIYDMKKDKKTKIIPWKGTPEWSYSCSHNVTGDFHIAFYDKDAVSKDDKMFHLWLHTAFINRYTLTFTKQQLDKAVKDKKHVNFPENFQLLIHFSSVPSHHKNIEYDEDDAHADSKDVHDGIIDSEDEENTDEDDDDGDPDHVPLPHRESSVMTLAIEEKKKKKKEKNKPETVKEEKEEEEGPPPPAPEEDLPPPPPERKDSEPPPAPTDEPEPPKVQSKPVVASTPAPTSSPFEHKLKPIPTETSKPYGFDDMTRNPAESVALPPPPSGYKPPAKTVVTVKPTAQELIDKNKPTSTQTSSSPATATTIVSTPPVASPSASPKLNGVSRLNGATTPPTTTSTQTAATVSTSAAATSTPTTTTTSSSSSSSSSGPFYPLAELQAGVPTGVDSKNKENHLNDTDFESIFKMNRDAWFKLPGWKRENEKRKQKLF